MTPEESKEIGALAVATAISTMGIVFAHIATLDAFMQTRFGAEALKRSGEFGTRPEPPK